MSMPEPARALPEWLPHWEEPGWWDRYWHDVRPRLVLVRVHVDRFRLRWGMPLWALEESLRFALLALPWIAYGWRWLPARWRSELARPDRRARIVLESPDRVPWAALVALLEGHGEGMLRLESGEPFVLVEAGDGEQRVQVEITQF
jgi:hypothetical protein